MRRDFSVRSLCTGEPDRGSHPGLDWTERLCYNGIDSKTSRKLVPLSAFPNTYDSHATLAPGEENPIHRSAA